ncbi:MAG: hypothetical protein PS018_11655 [bacterium]|nr:hypothetical protein [bacterium]
MNVGEDMDRLAAEGILTSFHMIRVDNRWQVYVNCGSTGSKHARTAAAPAAALAAALADLPGIVEYDRQYGHTAVTERALAEAAVLGQSAVVVKAVGGDVVIEPAGIFD